MSSRAWVLGLGFVLGGAAASCARPPVASDRPPIAEAAAAAAATPDPGSESELDIAKARTRTDSIGIGKPAIVWRELTPAVLAESRRARRPILLDCVATWCHWCHVMDETTYKDPELAALVGERYTAVRVDVDARPDIASRYEDWGWPATVILSPDGEELGKFRGYLTADTLREALAGAVAGGDGRAARPGQPDERVGLLETAPPANLLEWVGAYTTTAFDDYYDKAEGGWGRPQKLPLGRNIEFELLRSRHGDGAALARVTTSLTNQRALYDPVWGGVYQYSTGGVWTQPHFEKRMPIQTQTIESLARAYAATHDPEYLRDALRIERYLDGFLRIDSGEYLVAQDADLGGYEGAGRFVSGHDYYALPDAERRKLGLPRIDRAVYPYENGLAIAALTALYVAAPAAPEAAQLRARAEQAADRLLLTHVDADGAVRRTAQKGAGLRFLADAAAFGRGLVMLADATARPRYRKAAELIAASLLRQFSAAPGAPAADALLYASTPDPGAAGVFARRQQPFEANVIAARFFLALAGKEHRERAQKLLVGLSVPSRLSAQGRMLGEYLLALDELGALRWADAAAGPRSQRP